MPRYLWDVGMVETRLAEVGEAVTALELWAVLLCVGVIFVILVVLSTCIYLGMKKSYDEEDFQLAPDTLEGGESLVTFEEDELGHYHQIEEEDGVIGNTKVEVVTSENTRAHVPQPQQVVWQQPPTSPPPLYSETPASSTAPIGADLKADKSSLMAPSYAPISNDAVESLQPMLSVSLQTNTPASVDLGPPPYEVVTSPGLEEYASVTNSAVERSEIITLALTSIPPPITIEEKIKEVNQSPELSAKKDESPAKTPKSSILATIIGSISSALTSPNASSKSPEPVESAPASVLVKVPENAGAPTTQQDGGNRISKLNDIAEASSLCVEEPSSPVRSITLEEFLGQSSPERQGHSTLEQMQEPSSQLKNM